MTAKKPITLTRAQLNKLKEDITWKTLTLFMAAAMDEMGWDEMEIADFAIRLDRYADAIDQHLITIDKIARIIEDTIGVKVKAKRSKLS